MNVYNVSFGNMVTDLNCTSKLGILFYNTCLTYTQITECVCVRAHVRACVRVN